MPGARSPSRDKAYELWVKSDKKRLLKDIAVELGVSDTQIRKWKHQDKWESVSRVTLPEPKSNVTKPKSRGAPKGNQNAKGSGAPKGNKNNYKHGIYEEIYWDTLDDEEQALIHDMQFEEEQTLIDQIKLLTVRERRLMKEIGKNKEVKGYTSLDSVIKRKLEIKGNIIEDDEQIQTETTTRTISIFEVILKLEAELTRVQSKKTRCIEALNKIRIDRKRFNSDAEYSAQNDGFIEAMTNQTSNIWDDDKEGVGDEPS